MGPISNLNTYGFVLFIILCLFIIAWFIVYNENSKIKEEQKKKQQCFDNLPIFSKDREDFLLMRKKGLFDRDISNKNLVFSLDRNERISTQKCLKGLYLCHLNFPFLKVLGTRSSGYADRDNYLEIKDDLGKTVEIEAWKTYPRSLEGIL